MSDYANKTFDVVIVGSGPAGLTAALYTARANLAPIVFEGPEPGGQLTTTTEVENFPGYPEGVTGPEMMEQFRAQATRFGADCRWGMVTEVDFNVRPFRLVVDEEHTLFAKAVIVATGASAKWMGLPNEQRLRGKGVTACATCDGAFFRNQHIIVIGGGDTAMEEATYLTRFASKVTLVHRRDEFRASKVMQKRVLEHPKIEVAWNSVVDDVLGEHVVEGVRLKNVVTGETTVLADVTGVFLAIGHKPNTDLFKGVLDMDENGYLITQGKSTYTNIEGVFACGDVQDHVYRQAVTAAGSGCAAAIDAERWLEAQH
jgi:thioredoxin reductase (NADPH)